MFQRRVKIIETVGKKKPVKISVIIQWYVFSKIKNNLSLNLPFKKISLKPEKK